MIIEQRRRDLGGFEVGRVLPCPQRRMVGPFIFFDHMGPVDFPPGIPKTVDVRPHPHIGLATLTYLFAGEIMHRDSVGSEQAIRPGEVNWMIAGRGITHSERFERARREGGLTDGIQAWVALPREHEEDEPGFSHHAAAQIPAFAEGAARLRLIAGAAMGHRSPVPVHSPLCYLHCELRGSATLPVEHREMGVYVASGTMQIDGTTHAPGRMVVLDGAKSLRLSGNGTAIIIGGEPLGERHIEWNFVSSTKERIEQAKADWRAGRMKLPDADNRESIPLP
jgi:redox-sensitive bicupin YhaK (pirin superfamily)